MGEMGKISLIESKKENIYFSDSIYFNPSGRK